jgi:TolB protein
VRAPAWSPDGRWIVFEADIASFRDLYRIRPDGTGLTRLTANEEGNFDATVSPDGRWIVFTSSRDGDTEIYRMHADGSGQQRLTAFHREDWGARWAPDGRTLAFLSNREAGVDGLFLMAADGAGQRRIAPGSPFPGPDSLRVESFAWAPDGRIVYVTRGNNGIPARLWIVDPRTGTTTPLTDGTANDEFPAWSPDGRYIAFTSERDNDPELYLMRADGSAPTRLTSTAGPDWLPVWVP